MDNQRKEMWPGWETVRLIGRGSFGAVYEIQRHVFDETEKAALKVISIPQNSADIWELYSDGYDEESITNTFRSHLKSIVSEYSLMRRLNGNTNIVHCDDVRYELHEDGIGWDIFIKMELLTPMTAFLTGEISEAMVIKVGKDICSALELCRQRGIIHRDIKPQNIFVSPTGDYKLGDFGIAKTVEKTMGGTKIGTYKYMAPEVYHNHPYGSAADIYSLGLVLYWMLNDRRLPFMPMPPAKLDAGMEEAARQCRLSGKVIPTPKNGCEELKRIVLKACDFDQRNRFATAGEMLEALDKIRPAADMSPNRSIPAAVMQEEGDETQCLFAPQMIPVQTLERASETAVEKTAELLPEQTSGPGKAPRIKNTRRLGKNRKIRIIPQIVMLLSTVVLLFPLFLMLVHSWRDADCENPKTCKICGRQEGEALGHDWLEATCLTAKCCQRCGDIEGESLGHDWQAATKYWPQVCSRCDMTEGFPLAPTLLGGVEEIASYAVSCVKWDLSGNAVSIIHVDSTYSDDISYTLRNMDGEKTDNVKIRLEKEGQTWRFCILEGTEPGIYRIDTLRVDIVLCYGWVGDLYWVEEADSLIHFKARNYRNGKYLYPVELDSGDHMSMTQDPELAASFDSISEIAVGVEESENGPELTMDGYYLSIDH